LSWDTEAGAGGAPQDALVVINGQPKQLIKLGNSQTYFVKDSAPASCTTFAFGAKTPSKNYRYPEGGNVQWGCTSDYAVDAQTCDPCSNGICFQGNCFSFSVTNPPSSASFLMTSAVLVATIVLFAMML
jgi:hypothetical protein